LKGNLGNYKQGEEIETLSFCFVRMGKIYSADRVETPLGPVQFSAIQTTPDKTRMSDDFMSIQ
jgi:hypothetical protein